MEHSSIEAQIPLAPSYLIPCCVLPSQTFWAARVCLVPAKLPWECQGADVPDVSLNQQWMEACG